MKATPSVETPLNTRVSETAPSHLAYLMGQIQQRPFSGGAFRYQANARIFPMKKAEPTPPHQLDGESLAAFLFFQNIGLALSENFSRGELKTTFRKLALRLHPDQQGDAQLFIKLRTAYRQLSVLPSLK